MFQSSKAFSLVELLVSLIILSLLIAAFSPLVTKKLKANDITVGSFGNASNNNGITVQRNVTKEDCKNLNAIYVPAGVNVARPICVMKYNIGDNGNEDWTGVKKCEAGKDCEVQNGLSEEATKENLQAACWVATSDKNTAGTRCNNNYGGYDGCKRTLCNWTGANQMCSNIGWRLPTKGELSAFTNDAYSSKETYESKGESLMFCDGSNSSVSPQCQFLEAGCLGAQTGYCRPYYVWSSTSSSSKAEHRYLSSTWDGNENYFGYAYSARCVIDAINEDTEKPNQEVECNCENGTCGEGKTFCASCNEGYTLYNNQCAKGSETNCYDYFCSVCTSTTEGTCSLCKDGYVLHNGKCYFGTLVGCNNPTYDDTYQRINCESCKNGYVKCNSGSCTLSSKLSAPCPSNAIKIGCTCVAKYNIGDGYYGENWAGVKKCTAGTACSITNGASESTMARKVQAACFKGTTGGTNCNSKYGGYDGCKRTICNWTGGYKMCDNIGWRMPTMPELIAFANMTYSNSTLAANGLMFCDEYDKTASPRCPYIHTGCPNGYKNYCNPKHIWSSSFEPPFKAWDRYLMNEWFDIDNYFGHSASVRCVKDL